MRSLIATALAAVVATLAVLLAPPAPAAAQRSLIALGDSYSSGEGVPPFEAGTATRGNSCDRSTRAWPVIVARSFPTPVLSFACSGATADDVLDDHPANPEPERRVAQVDRLTGQTPGIVTLSIGGNDVGFAKVLATCILRADCRKTYHQGAHDVLETRIAKLAQKLPEVYGRIRAVAPTATLVVTDYPRIFTPRRDKLNCAALVGALSPAEARYLNARAASLDAAIAAAAQDPGVVFVEVRDALARHELSCRGGAWVHATRLPLRYSFHPTARGQQAIAAAVSRVLQQRGIRP